MRIARIADRVVVAEVFLERVHDDRAVVAHIADPVVIDVGLVGVRRVRAVVDGIGDAIAISIENCGVELLLGLVQPEHPVATGERDYRERAPHSASSPY